MERWQTVLITSLITYHGRRTCRFYLRRTSGFYIYKSTVMTELNRRIGNKPLIVEVGEIESIDIDEAQDFDIADAIFNHLLKDNFH